jgi:hypothetical protein
MGLCSSPLCGLSPFLVQKCIYTVLLFTILSPPLFSVTLILSRSLSPAHMVCTLVPGLLLSDSFLIINRHQDQIEEQSPANKAVSIIDGYKDMCDELSDDRDQVLVELEEELKRNERLENKINSNEVRYLCFLFIPRLMSCPFL